MNRGYWTLAIWLLAFFNLLWAKLPGPSVVQRGFLFRKKGKGIEVFDSDGQISQLFPDRITGITVQEVKPLAGGRYTADREPLRSTVEVEITKPDTAKLRDLNSEVEDVLLKGSGQIAIVTGVVKKGKLEVEKEFLGKGIGRGAWEIQPWEK
jgi:hypothetical protein